MAKFSRTSLRKLRTTHIDLQTLFQVVVKFFDCTIVSGNRTTDEQQVLYAKGRTALGGIITYKDGIIKKSRHQGGLAADVIPYPIEWSDHNRMRYFAGFVMGIAKILKEQGIINSEIRWGGDWDSDTQLADNTFQDLVHFEIR